MAKIVLTVGGYVLGNMLLPGLGGAIGGLVGGYVGGMVDQQLFGGTASQTVYGARMQDLRVQSSSYGAVIPLLYGKGRMAANVIWMRGFDEEVRTDTQTVGGGGKGGGSGGQTVTNVTYHYYADVAVGLCAGPIAAVRRVFADGNAFETDKVGDMRVYLGNETQAAAHADRRSVLGDKEHPLVVGERARPARRRRADRTCHGLGTARQADLVH